MRTLRGFESLAVILLSLSAVSSAQAGATITLSTTPSGSATFDSQVTLSTTVSPSAATGNVTFYDGTTVLGTSALTSGQAVLKTSFLAAGNRLLTALYGGDATYAASASAAVPLAVNSVPAGTFAPAVNYSTGVSSYPRSAAVGDFNGDGKLDVAVAVLSGVSVLLGNGDGTFQNGVNYSAGRSVFSKVAVGDFNGDGKPDLVVSTSDGVSVLLGNGNGTFQPPVNYGNGTISPGSNDVVVGDFNGDGKADLASVYSNFISVLLGNGNGTFQNAVNYAVGLQPISIAVGDLNGDGKADLAAANNVSGTVSILLGNGNGTFQNAVDYAAGSNPESIVIADLNGDGKADMAFINSGQFVVTVRMGNGDGTFQGPVNYAAGTSPIFVTPGDFNGDGKVDLAVANYGGKNVSILLGNGNGMFQSPIQSGVGDSPRSLAVGDFNADGRTDLAVANFNADNISILLGAPPPSAIAVLPSTGGGVSGLFSFTFADAGGATDIGSTFMLVNAAFSTSYGCTVLYVRAPNVLYLYNDQGNALVSGSVTPGGAGSVSNGQCTLTSGGAVVVSGNTLTVPITLTFGPAFGGNKTIYGYAQSIGGQSAGWQTLGTWTPAPSQSPSLVAVSPINGSGSPQTFTATFSEPNGVGDLRAIYVLFNPSLSVSHGCAVLYVPYSNAMYLYDDAGSGFISGTIAPGSAGTLSNTQCTISNAGPATVSGTNLTLPVAVAFTSSFSGSKNVYAFAGNFEVMYSSIQPAGTWTPSPSQAPTVVSVSPINGSGSPATFNATFGEQNGVSDFNAVYLLFNTAISAANGCLILYQPFANAVYLYNDAGLGFIPGSISPGAAGTLSNSQCTISNAGPAAVAGTNLTLPVTITFTAGFAGAKNVYGIALNFENMVSGWQTLGTWTPH